MNHSGGDHPDNQSHERVGGKGEKIADLSLCRPFEATSNHADSGNQKVNQKQDKQPLQNTQQQAMGGGSL